MGTHGDSRSHLEAEPLRSKDRGFFSYNIDEFNLLSNFFYSNRKFCGKIVDRITIKVLHYIGPTRVCSRPMPKCILSKTIIYNYNYVNYYEKLIRLLASQPDGPLD